MTGKRQRRLRRLVNRAARAWARTNRHQGFSMATALEWRGHLARQMRVYTPEQVAWFEYAVVVST